MLTAGREAQMRYGTNYAISGNDGVHPNWAGHTVMAYAFLKAFGFKGDIGAFTVDLRKNKMKISNGHELISSKDGEFQIKSSRYPFCDCVEDNNQNGSYPICSKDDPTRDNSIRSATTLIPFNQDLNRLILVADHGKATSYQVTWGSESKTFSAEQLAQGINLATEFPANPFTEAFAKVDAAVKAKQAFETTQIKQRFRSAEAKANMEEVVKQTEVERQPLEDAIKAAFVPVTHTLRIEAR